MSPVPTGGRTSSAAGISLREFARRDGCDPKLVREAVKKGRLTALSDAKLDPALVGSGWRERNRRGHKLACDLGGDTGGDTGGDRGEGCPLAVPTEELEPQPHGGALRRTRSGTPDEDLEVAAERLAADPACTLSMADAERLKENYLARLRQLEYDTKAGLVVPVAEVAAEAGQAFATVRTKLLALPAEHAPRLHRLKTVLELQDALARLITEALEELSCAGALRPRD